MGIRPPPRTGRPSGYTVLSRAIVALAGMLSGAAHAVTIPEIKPGPPSQACFDGASSLSARSSRLDTSVVVALDGTLAESSLARVRRAQETVARTTLDTGASLSASRGFGPFDRCDRGELDGQQILAEIAIPSPVVQVLAAPPGGPEATFQRESAPRFFGSSSVEIGRTPLHEKLGAARAGLMTPGQGPWTRMVRSAGRHSRATAIGRVNAWVNHWVRFREDTSEHGTGTDNWALPSQTLASKLGDCEDIALAKMALLRRLGIAERDLYLVVVYDQIMRRDHALLVVRSEGRWLAMDNRSDALIDAATGRDYRPIMSFSGRRAWLHGAEATDERSLHRISAL